MAPPVRKPHDPMYGLPPETNAQYKGMLNDVQRKAFVKEKTRDLYRESSPKELETIAVTKEELTGYETVLNDGRYGVFRLIPDQNCEGSDAESTKGYSCVKYSMPGNGSSYSFRTKDYRISRLSDILYRDNVLRVGARFTMGILGRLEGDDLGALSANSEGVKEVASIPAPKDLNEIKKQYLKLEAGFNLGGHFYSNELPLTNGGVYVLRSIAFRGTSPQTIEGITYDESNFDQRIDLLVVFKIIRKVDDGSIIILWKELEHQDSPKLKSKK